MVTIMPTFLYTMLYNVNDVTWWLDHYLLSIYETAGLFKIYTEKISKHISFITNFLNY